MSERLDDLWRAVELACNCKARHSSSTAVKETFRDEVVWEGVVETFDLSGNPKAVRCYAFHIMTDDGPQFTTVLEIPPVDSPQTAVKVAIAAKAKQQ